MLKNRKRGFTIVELVVVIAVIAVLAAVLIPTFSNIIARSKISADTQLCRNLNTVLTMATSEGRVPQSMYDVLYLVSESGYLLGNLNPTAEGYYYAWDTVGQKIVYIQNDLDTVYYPEDYTIDKTKCWITVGDQAEAERVAAKGYNLYLENNIEMIELHNVAVSIDTGAYRLGSLVVDGAVGTATTSVLSGNFGSTTLDVQNASFTQSGNIQTLNVGSNTAAMSINGNVGSLSSSISGTTMSTTGAIGSINSGSVTVGTTTISSSDVAPNTTITGSVANDGKIAVGTKEAIENIRTQIAGGRNFDGETIELSNDVNMAGIAFQPLSNNNRSAKSATDTAKWFQGEFDGKGYTIKNFSTNGFSIAGLNAGTNSTSVAFGGTTYSEAVYGLFGTVYVPAGETVTIKNLNIETSIDMVLDDGNKYVGDSVGALIGFAYGSGTLKIENVTISGVVNGYDGIAAFIGRAYGVGSGTKMLTISFSGCTNNATVNSVRKSGAFIGSASNINKSFTNCVNNGNITCYGIEKDQALGANVSMTATPESANNKSYYQCGLFMDNSTVAQKTYDGITNNGTLKVGM